MGVQAIDPQTLIQRMFQGQQNPLYPQGAEYGGPAPQAQPTAPAPAASPTPAAPAPEAEPPRGVVSAAMKPPMSQQDFATANPNASAAFMPTRPVGDFDPDTPHPQLRHALASLFAGMAEFGRPGSGFAIANRIQDQGTAQREYDASLPKMKAGALNQAYQQYLTQGGEQANISHTQAETNNLVLNPPGKAEFLKELQERRLSGQDDPQSLFDEFAARAPYSHATRQEVGDMIRSTKPLPPNFKTAGGTIEPLTYGGQRYGLEASPNEPPEIASARNTAVTSLRQAEAGKFPPAVIAQLGQPPLNDPAKMKKYGADAEKIITRMAAAPRVEMMMSRPTQVADESGQVHYETAGQAMKEGGLAPTSASVSTQKHLQQAFTSGDQGKQLTAISTAREHMKTFQQLADALDNGNVQVLNRIGNALGVQFGSDKATNFKIAAQAFGGEVGKAFDGAGVTEGERKAAQGAFNPNMSPQQFRGAIQTVDSLLAGKQTALKQSYTSGQKGQPNFGQGGQTSGQPPQGATHIVPGRDGKNHYTNAAGTVDLGVAP